MPCRYFKKKSFWHASLYAGDKYPAKSPVIGAPGKTSRPASQCLSLLLSKQAAQRPHEYILEPQASD